MAQFKAQRAQGAQLIRVRPELQGVADGPGAVHVFEDATLRPAPGSRRQAETGGHALHVRRSAFHDFPLFPNFSAQSTHERIVTGRATSLLCLCTGPCCPSAVSRPARGHRKTETYRLIHGIMASRAVAPSMDIGAGPGKTGNRLLVPEAPRRRLAQRALPSSSTRLPSALP